MATIKNVYELSPVDGALSFYGKARVICYSDGSKVLVSYNTKVMKRFADGSLKRLWGDWSMTTGRHIYAFCGLRKKELDKMSTRKTYIRHNGKIEEKEE